MAKETTLLVDTGSRAPASALALRALAARLAENIGRPVLPASLLHSDEIPAEKLGGVAALSFEQAAARAAAQGAEQITVVPLFIGPSRSLTSVIPEQCRRAAPGLRLLAAPPLYGPDGALCRLLAENLLAAGWNHGRRVLLCDHGSPSPAVAAVRDALAAELRADLGLGLDELAACSMERRPGPDYAFCEPLLAAAIAAAPDAIVLLQFLLPGRHAGPGGDVASICLKQAPQAGWKLSPLIGDHPGLPDLLAVRYKQAAPVPAAG